MASPLRPNFFRATLDNDVKGANYWPFTKSKDFWKDMNKKFDSTNVSFSKENSSITVIRSYEDKVNLQITYTIAADGQIGVKYELDAKESQPDLLRIGMTMGVPSNLENAMYYGKGPWENYIRITSYNVCYTKLLRKSIEQNVCETSCKI